VEEPVLPAVDDEFIRSLDSTVGGMEAFHEMIRENMERELQERIRKVIKRQIMESLLEANPISLLPQTLIKAQIANIARQAGFPDADDEKNNQFKAQLFGLEARRRTAFGLILMQLAQANGIEVDEARVRSYLSAISSTYEEPAAVLQRYERTPELMGSIRAMALEEQVVDWLLERAQITDKPISFEEIMQPETVMVIQAPGAAAQQASSNDHA
jgi:trigger factor